MGGGLNKAPMMGNKSDKLASVLEVCIGMGFPWDSRGNGSSFGLLMEWEWD